MANRMDAFDFLYIGIGGAFTSLIVGLLLVVHANSELASNLESATFAIVLGKQQDVVLPYLRKVMADLPPDLTKLNLQQNDSIRVPSEAYAKLAQLSDKIQVIRDHTSDAMIAGPVCALATFASGVLIQIGNSLAPWATVASAILGWLYFNWGIFQRKRIRALERINRRLLTSWSIDELRNIADEALTKHLS